MGDTGGRKPLLAEYVRMRQVPRVRHPEVVEFVRHHRWNGKGIGWIDAHLLASALVGRSTLWTADARLAGAAIRLGIAYRPDAE